MLNQLSKENKTMKSVLENFKKDGFNVHIELENDLFIEGRISVDGNHRDFYLTTKDFTLVEWVYDHHTGTYNDKVLLEIPVADFDLMSSKTKEIFDDIRAEQLYLENMEG